MKTIKTYELPNVKYHFQPTGRTWAFEVPADKMENRLPFIVFHKAGGSTTAHKVASIINGAIKRTAGKGLDGLARANISQIIGV